MAGGIFTDTSGNDAVMIAAEQRRRASAAIASTAGPTGPPWQPAPNDRRRIVAATAARNAIILRIGTIW